MSIDTIVMNPERIKNLDEVGDILYRINAYEQEMGSIAGVLLLQNRSLGGVYLIESKENAEYELTRPILNNPRTPEWGIRFYTKQYFEQLKRRLCGEINIDLFRYVQKRQRPSYQTVTSINPSSLVESHELK